MAPGDQCDLCGASLAGLADESATGHDPAVFQHHIEMLSQRLKQAEAGTLTPDQLAHLCPDCSRATTQAGAQRAIEERIADLAAWRAAEHI